MTYAGSTYGGSRYAGTASNAQTTTDTATISGNGTVGTEDTVTRRGRVTVSGAGAVETTLTIRETSTVAGTGDTAATATITATSVTAGSGDVAAITTIAGTSASAGTGRVTAAPTVASTSASAGTGEANVTGTVINTSQPTVSGVGTTTATGTITITDQATPGTTITWGHGIWGTGTWSDQLALESEQLDILRDNWPFDQIYPTQSEAVHDHLLTIEQALNRLDARIDEVSQESRIDTATDERLNALVGEINLTRETGESNERLQFRGTANKVVGRSQGTVRDFETVLALIFGEDVVSGFDISSPSSEPVVQLTVPTSAINDIPLTQSELEGILEDAIPHADTLRLLTDDTFIFGESDKQGLGNGKLI